MICLQSANPVDIPLQLNIKYHHDDDDDDDDDDLLPNPLLYQKLVT